MNRPPPPLPPPDPPAVKGAALVGKALDLLNIIGSADGPVPAAELTARTGWPRATVYRILSALTAGGYARLAHDDHGYALGYRFLEMAQNALSADNLSGVAAPELRRLRNLTGETGYLVTLDDGMAVSLGRFESPHTHRTLGTTAGGRRPLHCTAHGKAMLAHLNAAEMERLIEAPRLAAITPATITDTDEMRLHLVEIRSRGYAIDDEEVVAGIRAVGAAVIGPAGKVLGAISIAGPAYRLTPSRAMLLGPEIAAAAQRIGAMATEAASPVRDASGAQPMATAPMAAGRGISPLWDADRARLIWADAAASHVFATDEAGTTAALPPCPPATGLLLGANGPVALLRSGIAGLDAAGALHARRAPGLADVTALRAARDGVVWAARRLPDDAGAEVGPLVGGQVSAVWRLSDTVTALAWDHARDTLFAASEAQGAVHALRKGAPARILARLPAAAGGPCALAVDVAGQVWVALFDGWGVVRLNAFGDVDATLALPTPRPTGLAFGGPGLRTLFITTARDGLTSQVARNAPLSGRVFTLGMTTPGWAEPTAISDLG